MTGPKDKNENDSFILERSDMREMSQGTKTKGSQLPHEVRFKDKVCNICALNLLVLLSCALTLSQILPTRNPQFH